jgi:hypothetical protein
MFRESRRVQSDLTALDLLQHCGGGEGLGDAADAVSHVGRNGTAGADIGDSGGAAPDLVAVPYLGEYSGHSCAVDIVYGGFQFRGIEWVLHEGHPSVINDVTAGGRSTRRRFPLTVIGAALGRSSGRCQATGRGSLSRAGWML